MIRLLLIALTLTAATTHNDNVATFKRTYAKGVDHSTYALSIDMGGSSQKIEIQEDVDSGGAAPIASYHVLSQTGLEGLPPIPDLKSKLGKLGLPTAGKMKSADEFYIFTALAGVTTGVPISGGDSVSFNWTTGDNDTFTIQGKGKVTEIDLKKNDVVVDWNISLIMTSSQPPGQLHLISTYSLTDFRLIAATGSMGFGPGQEAPMAIKSIDKPAGG